MEALLAFSLPTMAATASWIRLQSSNNRCNRIMDLLRKVAHRNLLQKLYGVGCYITDLSTSSKILPLAAHLVVLSISLGDSSKFLDKDAEVPVGC